MEINTNFETYIFVGDEEYKVSVDCSGFLEDCEYYDGFDVERYSQISRINIDNIVILDNDEIIEFKTLSKSQKRKLVEMAEVELEENEWDEGFYEI